MQSFHIVQVLTRRVFSYYTLFCLLSLISLAIGIALIAEKSLQKEFESSCHSVSARAETRFALASIQGERSMQTLAAQIAKDKAVDYCAIIDDDRRCLVHSDRSYIGTLYSEPVLPHETIGQTKAFNVVGLEQSHLILTSPISLNKFNALLAIGFKRPVSWSLSKQWISHIPFVLIIPALVMLAGGWVVSRSLAPASQVLDQLSQFVKSPTVNLAQLNQVTGVDSMTVGWNRLVSDLDQRHGGDLNQRLEQNLQSRQQDRWQAMFDSFPEGVAETDMEGKITLINNALVAMLDENGKDDLLGNDLWSLLNTDPENSEQIEVNHNCASVTEIDKETPLGKRTLRIARNPIYRNDDSSQLTQLWSVRDITQQKLADKSREEFLDAATHELRTPLSNIKAYAETLSLNEMLDVEQQKEFCNIINSEATRLARFIDELLTVSSIEAGSLSAKRQKVELTRLLDDVIAKVQPLMEQKNITLEATFSPKLPELRLDKDKFVTSLVNLLGNAVKYTPDGGHVAIKAHVHQDQLVINVQDSGIGISEEDVGRVFDKFFRSADERVHEETGSGLGLAFAQEVIRLHGGSIAVTSKLDQGSTFTITMPVHDGRPPMFDVSVQGAVTVMQLSKPLVEEVVETFHQISDQALRGGQAMVVFDMSEIPFVDGQGLDSLLEIQKSFLKRGGRIKLTKPNALVRDVMRITKIDDRFEVHDSVTLAVGSFAK